MSYDKPNGVERAICVKKTNLRERVKGGEKPSFYKRAKQYNKPKG